MLHNVDKVFARARECRVERNKNVTKVGLENVATGKADEKFYPFNSFRAGVEFRIRSS